MKKFVSWRRVSTKKQGASGLGLEAQLEIIRYFIDREGGEWIADFEECYTGTDLSGCVALKKAIQCAQENDAVLIIAKTDRFRNTIEALQVYDKMGDGKIMFCDLPHTDKFTLTLFFALAEREALIVSLRTKQALDAKRLRGESTGGASEKWAQAFKNKTTEQRKAESAKRGETKSARYRSSRDVQVFVKILANVFKCEGDPSTWDWERVTTRGENKERILSLMRLYKDMDDSKMLFPKWDFNSGEKALQAKLCATIQNIRNSFMNHN